MRKYYLMALLVLTAGAVFGQSVEQVHQVKHMSSCTESVAHDEKMAEASCSDLLQEEHQQENLQSFATRVLPLCCTVIAVAGLSYILKNAISETISIAVKSFVVLTTIKML